MERTTPTVAKVFRRYGADVHQLAPDVEVRPEFYVPYVDSLARALETFAMPQDLAIRTSGDPAALIAPVHDAI